jgi:carbon storage regulator
VLVLTRKIDQSVAIGDDVVVVIVGIERDRVKLGIVAPPERAIRRFSTAAPSARRSRRSAEVPRTT